ncbi:probable protein S-acyltransferase 23 isoform X1 [Lytechinus variegatus]|uniref:probable protein S-acyltransferase 23 isoform X1 n=1 Tax=Lytechinus variegatus TaxID=7654 RepID=UPI001BB2A352|nr:probable protein S-acyltransferase 23 isoform X1 [Lytechinus variegatus]
MEAAPTMFAPFASNIKKNPPGLDFAGTKIVDAIQNNWVYEQIVQVIQAQPNGINEKGWHGFTPLHRAALRGDPAIITLLLEHGADVNALNDYGETPVMYACKRGNPKNVSLLLDAGSQLDAEDHQGRKPVHHAAAGGSVHTLHYLEQVHGVTFDETDKNGQTPLHVTCYQGFQDAVKYLLRKGRSDVLLPDIHGNLPIHIACLNSLSETCWTLLEMSSCQTLLIKNKEGKSPLDVLREGRSMPHQYLFKEMEYWAQSKAPHLPPKGPLLSWYTLLFGPFIYFATIVVVGSHLKQYAGVVMALFTAILVFLISNQHHRISHISRWANPVQAGAFFAGITHTAICYFYKVLPVLWPDTVCLSLLILVPLAFVMLTLYVRLLTGDPGTCKTSERNSQDGSLLTIEDVVKGRCKMDVFCVTCELIPAETVKHCKMCRRCVRNFDHHCQFLLRCIGQRNHRAFVIFILITTLMHATFVIHAAQYLFLVHRQLEWIPFFKALLIYEGWVCLLMLMNAVSFVGNLNLSRFQLRMMSFGLTTFDMIQRSRRTRFRLSTAHMKWSVRLRNVHAFFMGQPFVAIYQGGQSGSSSV